MGDAGPGLRRMSRRGWCATAVNRSWYNGSEKKRGYTTDLSSVPWMLVQRRASFVRVSGASACSCVTVDSSLSRYGLPGVDDLFPRTTRALHQRPPAKGARVVVEVRAQGWWITRRTILGNAMRQRTIATLSCMWRPTVRFEQWSRIVL